MSPLALTQLHESWLRVSERVFVEHLRPAQRSADRQQTSIAAGPADAIGSCRHDPVRAEVPVGARSAGDRPSSSAVERTTDDGLDGCDTPAGAPGRGIPGQRTRGGLPIDQRLITCEYDQVTNSLAAITLLALTACGGAEDSDAELRTHRGRPTNRRRSRIPVPTPLTTRPTTRADARRTTQRRRRLTRRGGGLGGRGRRGSRLGRGRRRHRRRRPGLLHGGRCRLRPGAPRWTSAPSSPTRRPET